VGSQFGRLYSSVMDFLPIKVITLFSRRPIMAETNRQVLGGDTSERTNSPMGPPLNDPLAPWYQPHYPSPQPTTAPTSAPTPASEPKK
jgi:hypothetical protein